MKMELDNVASKTILHRQYIKNIGRNRTILKKKSFQLFRSRGRRKKNRKKDKKKDTRVFFSCVRNYFLPCIKYMDIISQQGFGGSFNSSTAQ